MSRKPSRMTHSSKSSLSAPKAILAGVCFGAVVMALVGQVQSLRKLHAYFSRGPACRSRVFVADSELGLMPELKAVSNAKPETARPTVLFLGDRHLWGECADAEDRCPRALQAGSAEDSSLGIPPAFNLAQLLLLARKTIPVSKPDFIVIRVLQLARRSIAASFSGKPGGKAERSVFFR